VLSSASSSSRGGGGSGGREGAAGRLYVLPNLGVRSYTLHEDLQYLALTLVMLLPTLAACISFLSHGLAACFLRHRALLLLLLLLVLAVQIVSLHTQLSASRSATATSWLLPLALPFASAVDLLASRRHGAMSFRLPFAALTLTAPIFMLLELQRLRSAPQPMVPASGTEWPEWMGLCKSARACGAPA
jgi:hypothetical protein